MRAVYIRIRHDDDLVVARLVQLELVFAHTGADGGDDGPDFLVGEDLVHPRFLHIEDFSAERKDRLERAVAALLGRAARAVALHQVELAHRRVGQ